MVAAWHLVKLVTLRLVQSLCTQATRLIIIFSPQLRSKYGRYWTKSRMLLMLCGCFCVACGLWVAAFWVKEIWLTLGTMLVLTTFLLTIMFWTKRLNVLDRIGIMAEQRRLLLCIVIWFCFVLPFRLNPNILSPLATTRLVTWLLLLIMACELLIV
jgi:hypothetical protein